MTDDTLPANLASSAFAGTAEDYARHRPPYPQELVDQLVALAPGRGRLLDLGCGPGRLALALAPAFDEVLAVDSEPEMIAVGQRIAEERGMANISWHCCRAEEFGVADDCLDVITIGEAFHRLEQDTVLERAYRWLKSGGVLATMGATNVLRGSQAWHLKVSELAETWTRDSFPRGWASALPGAASEPSLLRRKFESHGFIDIADYHFAQEYEWTIDHVLGYLRSMSVCSPAILGTRRADFEAAVRSTLAEINRDGLFPDVLEFGLTTMRRGAGTPAARSGS